MALREQSENYKYKKEILVNLRIDFRYKYLSIMLFGTESSLDAIKLVASLPFTPYFTMGNFALLLSNYELIKFWMLQFTET